MNAAAALLAAEDEGHSRAAGRGNHGAGQNGTDQRGISG